MRASAKQAVSVFVLIGSMAGLVAANEPTAPATAPTSVETKLPDVAKMAPQSAEETNEENLPAVEYRRVTQGYKKFRKGDEFTYCRDEKPLGSRLGKKYCFSLAQLVSMDRNREQNRALLERAQTLRPMRGE